MRVRIARTIAAARIIPIVGLVALLSCGGESPTKPPEPGPDTTPVQSAFPITGAVVAGMETYEATVRDLMQAYGIPGGAIAVVRDGKTIYIGRHMTPSFRYLSRIDKNQCPLPNSC